MFSICFFQSGVIMNQNQTRKWKVLSWNVRGINSRDKWNAIRDKVTDSACDIICFQETRKEEIDVNFLRNVCPPNFDRFEFLPSIGTSREFLLLGRVPYSVGN